MFFYSILDGMRKGWIVLAFLLANWAYLGTDTVESEGKTSTTEVIEERMKFGAGDNILAAGSTLTGIYRYFSYTGH